MWILVALLVVAVAVLTAQRFLRRRRSEALMIERLQAEAVEGGTLGYITLDEHGRPVEPPVL